MMGRYRRGLNLRPIHSIKHVVDSQNAIAAGGTSTVNAIRTRDAPVLANPQEVETGSTVNSIFLHVEVYVSTAAALANAYLIVFKNPASALVAPAANNVGASDLKKYVIHQEMVMMQQANSGNPRTLFHGVIKIPPGYRRMGTDDALAIIVHSPGNALFLCWEAIYKEYR